MILIISKARRSIILYEHDHEPRKLCCTIILSGGNSNEQKQSRGRLKKIAQPKLDGDLISRGKNNGIA